MRAAAVLALLAVVLCARPARGDGAYGGLALAGSLEPFGAGTELERHGHDLGAADCGTPIPIGGGVFGYWGVARGAWGLEGMLGAFGDLQRPSARFDGVPHEPFANPLLSTPPRDESFIILRGGAALALRARYTWPGETWRPSVAVGPGFAWRYMALEREVTTDAGLEDRPYFSTGTPYASPALSIDLSVQHRETATLAVVFGLGLWVESAWSDTRARADCCRTAEGNGMIAPLATPPYEMAHGLQLFVMPYVGLHFGQW